ncbi:uncharacterized protein STEHIDRAFT_162029 [Stereum hirsutum FP-91666 SS1]|uniref:uncharacterized protein n=1 Tax=Stereum hirsutum (strain FP-91666) TaxID=721885 RepID=UPI00044492D4|nr:uncharacterized protein STEHIDRAFT_162029 [Stereum hirsutum FP-91666 SS1]EIM81022.1 hypothetical protein STEHIDRAFT_162029 [Stereum hirsutum FP-91666 SS1]
MEEITTGRLTASIGCLIAALYHFEASQLEYSLVNGTFDSKDDLKDARTTVGGQSSQSKLAETLPPNDEAAGTRRFIAPRRAASTSHEPTSPFSILTTPFTTISLITFVFTHIPALLLSSAHPLYGLNHLALAAADIGSIGSPSMEAFIKLFANIPPPFLALVTVPSIVSLLCSATWVKGGREVWEYAERWNVLEKDEKTEEEDQALHSE